MVTQSSREPITRPSGDSRLIRCLRVAILLASLCHSSYPRGGPDRNGCESGSVTPTCNLVDDVLFSPTWHCFSTVLHLFPLMAQAGRPYRGVRLCHTMVSSRFDLLGEQVSHVTSEFSPAVWCIRSRRQTSALPRSGVNSEAMASPTSYSSGPPSTLVAEQIETSSTSLDGPRCMTGVSYSVSCRGPSPTRRRGPALCRPIFRRFLQ